MLRQRQVLSTAVPGGQRLWCKGLQPALQVTPDSGGLWMQFYEAEAYYWASLARLAATLSTIDPDGGAKLAAEAEAYRQDLRAAVDRSIALSPVVPVRDGTFHSVIPFACYVRGLSTGAWGWQRDGSGAHVGPLYWDTVQSAAALISPAGLLVAQGRAGAGISRRAGRSRCSWRIPMSAIGTWFDAGWQYQGGLERTANMHLAGDDIPVFLRSFLNCYAIDILPSDGYVFNEHAVHGPPDKIFEEAAFLERFRNLLVMEDGQDAVAGPRHAAGVAGAGQEDQCKNAPTHFGTVGLRNRLRRGQRQDRGHGGDALAKSAERQSCCGCGIPRPRRSRASRSTADPWTDFDAAKEVVRLHGVQGTVQVEATY